MFTCVSLDTRTAHTRASRDVSLLYLVIKQWGCSRGGRRPPLIPIGLRLGWDRQRRTSTVRLPYAGPIFVHVTCEPSAFCTFWTRRATLFFVSARRAWRRRVLACHEKAGSQKHTGLPRVRAERDNVSWMGSLLGALFPNPPPYTNTPHQTAVVQRQRSLVIVLTRSQASCQRAPYL
jgi:hypothetical protein